MHKVVSYHLKIDYNKLKFIMYKKKISKADKNTSKQRIIANKSNNIEKTEP